jgi:hypothetical protein
VLTFVNPISTGNARIYLILFSTYMSNMASVGAVDVDGRQVLETVTVMSIMGSAHRRCRFISIINAVKL